MFYIIVFILGSIWGSFANVCIHRLPIGESIVVKRSYCPDCKSKINWFNNIPLISFLILGGKCKSCKSGIDKRYFIVELTSVISFLFIYHFFGLSITSVLLAVLSIFFIIIFFIDLKHYIIPNALTFPLMIIGFVKSFDPNLNINLFPNYLNSLIGGILGYLVIWLIILFYKKIKDKEGMGLGDAKLLSAIGFWFGWVSIPFIIFLSSVIALIIVTPSLINKSKEMSSQIPFGPYLVIGCVLYLLLFKEILKFIII
ncbi:MAG: prepilin peptidase [Rhizobiales bacterium]|nr:prepilin peptidase [Hyphomicrobiales bacterium]